MKGGSQTATLRLAAWRRQHLGGLSPLSLLLAGAFLIAANTPSLLPRPWWLKGVLMAVFALLGCVLGVLAAAVLGGVRRWMGLEIIVDPGRARRPA